MALSYLFDPNTQFQNKNGVNNVSGYLEVFINDTDDRATTYRNFEGALNPRRIPIDSNGRAVVIVDNSKTYRIEVYGSQGNLLWSQHPLTAQITNPTINHYASVEGTEGEIAVTAYTDPETGIQTFIVGLDSRFSGQVQQNTEDIAAINEDVQELDEAVAGIGAKGLLVVNGQLRFG